MLKKQIGHILLRLHFFLDQQYYHFTPKNIIAQSDGNGLKVAIYSVICGFVSIAKILIPNAIKQNQKPKLQVLFPELLESGSDLSLKQKLGLIIRPSSDLLYSVLSVDKIKNYVFEINTSDEPKISILIPIYNKIEYTFNCLLTLSNLINSNNSDLKIEIIVINDNSSDETAFVLNNIKGIKVIHNNQNLGFLKSSNVAAQQAQGEFILLLNNDVQVCDDFVSPLLDVFANFENVGAVGGKLVYPSGLLQEAGGYVFNNSNAANYGRNSNPDYWQYNYIKKVDYCSGALLMIPKITWDKLNGFDESLAPCYYEDTDICFSVKHKLGKEVYYQPLSKVYHFEGVSSGNDVAKGAKKYQVINQNKFEIKWNYITKNLETVDYNALKNPFFDLKKKSQKQRILFVFSHVPQFDKDSGANRLVHILKICAPIMDCYLFLDEYDQNFNSQYASDLINAGVRLIYKHGHTNTDSSFEEICNAQFDFVWFLGFYLMDKYFKIAQNFDSKIIYDTVDLHFLRLERESQIMQKSNDFEEVKAKELEYISKSDLNFFVSDVELKLIDKLEVGNNQILSNIHEPTSNFGKSFEQRKGLLFIGGFNHKPNVDSVIWLKNSIMPLVWEQNPNISVDIIGSNPTSEILDLKSPNFSIHGFIPDVTNHFCENKIFVCPLRFGAGVKGKIGQALEFNLPIITTAIGAEGMALENKLNCYIAEDAISFANAILDLYKNEAVWNDFQQKSAFSLQKFSTQFAKSQILKIANGTIFN